MNWASIPGHDNGMLLKELESSLQSRITKGDFSDQDIKNISDRKLSLIPDNLSLSSERLEKLRRLCQLWEVDIRTAQISSHRKFIGPLIVRAKKILFPLVRFVMKDFIREQKDFNAATISLLADLCNESRSSHKE